MTTKTPIEKYQQQEILVTEHFKKFPKEKVIALSARIALRLLPLLCRRGGGKKDAFSFWPARRRAHNLMALLRVLNAVVARICVGDSIDPARLVDALDRTVSDLRLSRRVGKGIQNASIACRTVSLAGMVASDFSADMNCAAMMLVVPLDFPRVQGNQKDFNWLGPYKRQLTADLASLSDDNLSALDFIKLPLWSVEGAFEWLGARDQFDRELQYVGDGFSLWRGWYAGFYSGEIDADFIRLAHAIPDEVEAQGPVAINGYISALGNRSAHRPLNRVRAIFIGYGEAGKTSLIRVLHDEPVPEGAEPMTPGIDIREWKVPDSEISAHFWDFGGQVMVHATHQLFLRSSCLYVLVISARSEISASEQAEYWLEHVKTFGRGSPVMIVGNRFDQATLNLDMATLSEKYPNIVGFYPLSCTQARGAFASHAEKFRSDFCLQLKSLVTHQVMFTQSQFEVLQMLRELTLRQSFLPKAEFERLCENHGIREGIPQDRRWFLDILDKLGIIIHFPQLPFADGYVLNPRWLTYGVYKLMYAKMPRLEIHDVVRILSEERVIDEAGNELRYAPDKCRLVMDAMLEFKLSYPLNAGPKTIIIPALLPAEQLRFPFDKARSLAFEFAFEVFLPRHVMPELIVNRHQEIIDERVWQTGVHLKSDTLDAEALVTVDYHVRKMSIWVCGLDARDYLTILRDDLYSVLSRIDVQYKELIELPVDSQTAGKPVGAREKASYKQLLAHAAAGQTQFPSESGAIYDISKVLRHYVKVSKQESDVRQYFTFNGPVGRLEGNMSEKRIVINNSAVHGAVTLADQINGSFNVEPTQTGKADLKALVEELFIRVKELEARSSKSIEGDVREIVSDAEILMTEIESETPSEQRIKRRIDGILGAAKTVGEVGKSVLESAAAIQDLFF